MTRIPTNFSFTGIVAEKHGIMAALVFNRIDWSVDYHRTHCETKYFMKGYWWMFDTVSDFAAVFPFSSESTIKRALADLKKANLILHCRVRQKDWGQTNFYSINYPEFEKLKCQNGLLAPAVIVKFDVIDELRIQFGILANACEKAKVSFWSELRAQNDPSYGSKMTFTSLSISPPPSSGSINNSNSPLPPKGEKSGSDLLEGDLNPLERGKEDKPQPTEPIPSKISRIVSRSRPKQKPWNKYSKPLTPEELENWRFKPTLDPALEELDLFAEAF